MPVLHDTIKDIITRKDMDLSRTMNSQECVAKGCAIASAQACGQYSSKTGSLSYKVIEYNQYDIELEGNFQLPGQDDGSDIVATDSKEQSMGVTGSENHQGT